MEIHGNTAYMPTFCGPILGGAFGAKVTFGTPVASPGPQRHHEAVVEDLRSGFKAPVADPVRNGVNQITPINGQKMNG